MAGEIPQDEHCAFTSPTETLCGELEQQAECVSVGRCRVRAGTQLLQQAIGEETLIGRLEVVLIDRLQRDTHQGVW